MLPGPRAQGLREPPAAGERQVRTALWVGQLGQGLTREGLVEGGVEAESLAGVCLAPTSRGPARRLRRMACVGTTPSPVAAAGLGVTLGQEAHLAGRPQALTHLPAAGFRLLRGTCPGLRGLRRPVGPQ